MQPEQIVVGHNKAVVHSCASRTADKFVLRMPNGMRSRIETLAAERHRSMNAEMIIRLERSFIVTDVVALQAVLIQQLSARIQELESQQEVPDA